MYAVVSGGRGERGESQLILDVDDLEATIIGKFRGMRVHLRPNMPLVSSIRLITRIVLFVYHNDAFY